MHHPEIVELIISRIILQTESILFNHLNEFTKFHNQNLKSTIGLKIHDMCRLSFGGSVESP